MNRRRFRKVPRPPTLAKSGSASSERGRTLESVISRCGDAHLSADVVVVVVASAHLNW